MYLICWDESNKISFDYILIYRLWMNWKLSSQSENYKMQITLWAIIIIDVILE